VSEEENPDRKNLQQISVLCTFGALTLTQGPCDVAASAGALCTPLGRPCFIS